MQPFLVVTGILSLLWLEGACDWAGAWGSPDDDTYSGKGFV